MKDKIILFIIGLLVGAIISTGAFYVYTITNTNNTNSYQTNQMPGGTPASMPDGQNSQPPEIPNRNKSQDNNQSNSN